MNTFTAQGSSTQTPSLNNNIPTELLSPPAPRGFICSKFRPDGYINRFSASDNSKFHTFSANKDVLQKYIELMEAKSKELVPYFFPLACSSPKQSHCGGNGTQNSPLHSNSKISSISPITVPSQNIDVASTNFSHRCEKPSSVLNIELNKKETLNEKFQKTQFLNHSALATSSCGNVFSNEKLYQQSAIIVPSNDALGSPSLESIYSDVEETTKYGILPQKDVKYLSSLGNKALGLEYTAGSIEIKMTSLDSCEHEPHQNLSKPSSTKQIEGFTCQVSTKPPNNEELPPVKYGWLAEE